jgi:hypothetical protein
MMRTILVTGFLLALSFAVLPVCALDAGFAPVQVLIEVNVSNPAAVTFAATGNNSLINDSTAMGIDGVDLLAFFSGMESQQGGVSGNLTPPNQNDIAFNSWAADYYTSGYPICNDLNLYNNGGNPQIFSTGAPALTGAGTVDLSAYAAFLPSPGAIGDIAAGSFGQGSMGVIGQWQVVPEPATLAMLAMGGAVMLIRRRRTV